MTKVQPQRVISSIVGVLGLLGGCLTPATTTDGRGDTGTVADKAISVASQIGGTNGFGGAMMTGYLGHAPVMMGFANSTDLANPDATQTIVLRNESAVEATFHLTYFADYLGSGDQTQDVVVGAGQVGEIEIPCSEIVGLGPLTVPGGVGCQLAGGLEVANTMAVPIFLGMDFACTDVREFVLTPDSQDLDNDGDVAELILLSDGLVGHMQFGGPLGHSHRGGMMGSPMMMGDFGHWNDWYGLLDSSGSTP